MGKRSNFKRKPRDLYPTPYEAVIPLLPHLEPNTHFIEPCAGDGRLLKHFERHGHKCVYACDIEPLAPGIDRRDVLFFGKSFPPCERFITNPPWERKDDGTGPLHEMIKIFTNEAPTWLLFDADWMHTLQASPFAALCEKIVSVGRISWEGNGVSGMDNCAWYFFKRGAKPTTFIFR